MQECWRWFGPQDPISIDDVRQTGAHGVVSALHHLRPGVAWTPDLITQHKRLIEGTDARPTGLTWAVVESLPVSENIKRQTGDWRTDIATWLASLEALASFGIETICYNFMPLIDWTRTDLNFALPSGATCMRFDYIDFVVFDLFLLRRGSASYSDEITETATARFAEMSDTDCARLQHAILCGLPGAAGELSFDEMRAQLDLYSEISPGQLRRNLTDFLEMVVPTAERLGLRLCCHPDDPPFSLLGLPRIMSTEADYAHVMHAVDSMANGITLCTGSLGARGDNDLPGMMRRLGDRVHFLHLRNVHRDAMSTPCSFHESGHIDGDVDMIAVIQAVLHEENRRRDKGRNDHEIPFRPDHGLHMSDDRVRKGQPGYPLVGRHVGLAELRGIIATSQGLMS